MELTKGDRLGPYEIVSSLGAGGMGEVFRATDTRLGRHVALKVLSSTVVKDEVLQRRFKREARAISVLNHPHICALYDIGTEGEREFLVMEYLEGETLAHRLNEQSIPYDEALRYATQIASALDRAHRQGIVHRDLKPANIMLTAGGAKLLDFGLARMAERESPSVAPLTADDAMMGTFEYMAPEQLNGGSVDARADIFAFGIVLYEMLTGVRPFAGRNMASVVSAILFTVPETVSVHDATLSPQVDHLIAACLEKKAEDRIQNAHDVLLQLQWIAEGSTDVRVAKKRRKLGKWAGLAAAGIVMLMAGAVTGPLLWRRLQPPARWVTRSEVRFELMPPAPGEEVDWPVVSPDGRKVAVISENRAGLKTLWVRDLASTAYRKLVSRESSQPVWSPDGGTIAFFTNVQLETIDLASGQIQTLAEAASPRGITWGLDGTILFAPRITGGIVATTRVGEQAREVTHLDRAGQDVSHRWPEFFPDGEHFVFVIRSHKPNRSGIYVGSLHQKDVKKISTLQSRVLPMADGSLLFVRDRRLYQQRFDLPRLELIGTPALLAADIEPDLKVTGANHISAANGVLAFGSPANQRTRISWVDRAGKVIKRLSDADYFVNPKLSPDENTVAVSKINSETGRNSIWLADTATGSMSPFVDDDTNADAPIWRSDGSAILFSSDRRGSYEVYERSINSIKGSQLVLASTSYAQALADVPAGTLVHVASGGMGGTFSFLPRGTAVPRTVISAVDGGSAAFSPDGQWMALLRTRKEETLSNIYVQALADPAQAAQVSSAGGSAPGWRSDGREFYYVTLDGELVAVPINGTTLGVQKPLFKMNVANLHYSDRDYCPTRDGKRFLILDSDPNTKPSHATVVLMGTR